MTKPRRAPLTIGAGGLQVSEDLQHWINDGLMAVFFFVVGLEIKRELVVGELLDPRRAALPAVAAIGGMVLPALLFLALNQGGPGARGWGMPMATDIAFAVGVMALLGARVSAGAKLFLLRLAIVDDIIAVLVIAVYYSEQVSVGWLVAGLVGLLATAALVRLRLPGPLLYPLLMGCASMTCGIRRWHCRSPLAPIRRNCGLGGLARTTGRHVDLRVWLVGVTGLEPVTSSL